MESLNINKEEDDISADIFDRLKNIPLIDKYEAYQILSDEWAKIAVDLEIIQTEGVESIKKVDPNMVIKKKNNKEVEVQEGYIGHIIPFSLVQDTMLKDETDKIKNKENRISEISSQYQEIIDSLTEEEKEASYLNDTKDAFVAAEVKKAIKANTLESNVIEMLNKVNNLISEEKQLKSEVKKETEELHIFTKDTIENLTDEQANELIYQKWIAPLIDGLDKLPNAIIDSLISSLKAKMNKYATTFFDIEEEIKSTEKELCSMIDDLVGNDYDMQGLREFKALLGGE